MRPACCAARVVTTKPRRLLSALGLTCRARGDVAGAVRCFDRACALTNAPVYLLERARALGDGHQFRAALATVEQFVARAPDIPDTERALFVEWLEDCERGNPVALARDYDWVRRTALGHGDLVPMQEASTNVLSHPGISRGDPVRVAVSCLEAPSARLCVAIHSGYGNDPRKAEYSYGTVATPDPRLPRGDVSLILWHELDGVLVQNVAPPGDSICDLVVAIARTEPDLFAWWDQALIAADAIRGRVPDVAHAMVHPREPAAGDGEIASWVYRCQVAAAFVIARSDTKWRGSERRRVLIDVLRGPVDWTTAAVILALGEIAVHEPDALPEIRRELIALAAAIPAGGHVCFGATLAVTATKIPCFPPDVGQKLAADWLGHGDAADTPPVAPVAAQESASKKPWWKFWS